MNELEQLMADLASQGIQIGIQDGRIWFEPRSAVTEELLGRMGDHRSELLETLQSDPNADWQARLDKQEGDTLVSPNLLNRSSARR